jgi:exodeoxyribonuclease VII large subunit
MVWDEKNRKETQLSLSELLHHYKEVVDSALGRQSFWVIAEVSDFKAGKHYYMTLIEKDQANDDIQASVRATIWGNKGYVVTRFEDETGEQLKNGLKILCEVTFNYHVRYGLSLNITAIDSSFTIGDLRRRREEILKKLVNLNVGITDLGRGEFLAPNKKESLSAPVQVVAFVGSLDSAGHQDFIHSLENNPHGYAFMVHLYDARVQGERSEESLLEAFDRIERSGIDYDCVALIRGGGAETDLLTFNAFELSLKVATFPLPVITGLGHEKDVSICDLMAHTHVKTPTKAAEHIIQLNRDTELGVTKLWERISNRSFRIISEQEDVLRRMLAKLGKGRDRVQGRIGGLAALVNRIHISSRSLLSEHRGANMELYREIIYRVERMLDFQLQNSLRSLEKVIRSAQSNRQEAYYELEGTWENVVRETKYLIPSEEQKLESIYSILTRGTLDYFKEHEIRLNSIGKLIQYRDPEKILDHGYALVKKDGKVMKDASKLQEGGQITVAMKDGDIKSTIDEIIKK